MSDIPVLSSISQISARYAAVICDIWGVLHNGQRAFEGVVDALTAYRRSGGLVLLLSNAPRPSDPIREQLASLGISTRDYDAIVTSGDLTRALLQDRVAAGSVYRVHHVGPPRDHTLFQGMAGMELVALPEADAIVCTGPFDDTREGPDDYRSYWPPALARNLELLCANPDIQVQRGDQLIYCAGALAEDYERRGGRVVYLGKPHQPVYAFVERRLEEIAGRPIARSEMLAIGDGLKTDILGARQAGIDALLITGGVHEAELCNAAGTPDPARIAAALEQRGLKAVAAMHRLRW